MTLHEIVSDAQSFDSWPQTERIKFFGWYLQVHEGQRRFTTGDLRTCYKNLSIKDPDSFAPFFKSLEGGKPKDRQLHKDGGGYYFERRVLDGFTARFGGPSHTAPVTKRLLDLPSRLSDTAERGFIEEAITCIRAKAPRAAIVLGWCAVIDRMRRKIADVGFDKFNAASRRLKGETTGKFKNWNKGVEASSMADLLPIFDTDLMTVLEGMGLIDDNQHQRLKTLFQWRCHSAHPADAPIDDPHVVVFFTDAVNLVLANKKFELSSSSPSAIGAR